MSDESVAWCVNVRTASGALQQYYVSAETPGAAVRAAYTESSWLDRAYKVEIEVVPVDPRAIKLLPGLAREVADHFWHAALDHAVPQPSPDQQERETSAFDEAFAEWESNQ